MLVDGNWHLVLALERYWPKLVHGRFLWGGDPPDPVWCATSSRWLDQLEDGELVLEEHVYPRANYMVAPFLRRYDDRYVEVRTKGHGTLGEAVWELHHQQQLQRQ